MRKEVFNILRYSVRWGENSIYATCKSLENAIAMCNRLNDEKQGLVPYYIYTIQVKEVIMTDEREKNKKKQVS